MRARRLPPTFATRSFLAIFVGVLAFSALPSPASSQNCGYCENVPDLFRKKHTFSVAKLWPRWKCDNKGGCHYFSIWTNHCRDVHAACNPFLDASDDIESALSQADQRVFADALASSPSWDYDPVKSVLSFTSSCSQQYVVARYVLPEGFGI